MLLMVLADRVARVLFVIPPVLAPMPRGILATCTARTSATAEEALDAWARGQRRLGVEALAVVDHLDRVLPPAIRFHLFGVKGEALPYLTPFRHRVSSIDSQAYGIAARRAAYRGRASKTDALVADHLERWVAAQRRRLSRAARLPVQPCGAPAAAPAAAASGSR